MSVDFIRKFKNDKKKIRDAINTLYASAEIDKTFTGEINLKVVKLFNELLTEISSCSTRFKWVPNTSGGPISIAWMATSLSVGVLKNLSKKESFTCIKSRVWQYTRLLEIAGLGL
ncbi:hypothetical protein ACR30L_02025 [Psychromonas sp. PT13]|uniref:hypothetical protein n=1 Tax=Psychromonas sp. PT13 TaxID=3439547 RepID=UPI003EB95D9E